ncbi:hypothetical protein ACYOEI_29015 [Singulisphaera rosea]
MAREVSEILDRLGSSVGTWQTRLGGFRKGRLLGRFLASSRSRLEEVAARLGLGRVANLKGCPAV